MMFCPQCGTIMKFDSKRKVYICPKCGYEITSTNNKVVITRVYQHSLKERTAVIEGGSINAPPTATLVKGYVRCPKCGHDEVYAWQMQTRAADEPPTTFYKCAKCGYTWREY
jgi:DNA-directed RNA polymerase subunit M